jgi:hypothetical protein
MTTIAELGSFLAREQAAATPAAPPAALRNSQPADQRPNDADATPATPPLRAAASGGGPNGTGPGGADNLS